MRDPKRSVVRPTLVAILPVVLTIAGCGGDDDGTQVEEPVPTTVEISPESATLASISATQGFTAVVRDQTGKPMPSATVSWSSSDAGIFTVTGSGATATVTAAGNGAGTLTATSGQASGTAAVDVEQRAAKVEVVSGDGQEAVRGTQLPEALVVLAEDQGGTVIEGLPITFLPDAGNGSVSQTMVETDADGMASTQWTLGLDDRQQSLVAFSGEVSARFRATATADPPLADLEFAEVTLSRNDPSILETVDVMAEIVNLGGGATPATFALALRVDGQMVETIDVAQLEAGDTRNVELTVGPFAAGRHTIDLELDPDGEVEEWNANNNLATATVVVVDQKVLSVGEPATVSSNVAGPTFLFRIDVTEASDEALNIVLSGGSGDADLFVHYGDRPGHTDDYRCNSGNVDTNEACQLVPTRVGTYHVGVLAFSAFGPSTLEATVGGKDVKEFDIELVFLDNGTTSQDAIIEQAAKRWEAVIGREAPDWPFYAQGNPFPAGNCGPNSPGVTDVVNDIRIFVTIDSIDGQGDVIGQAGVCDVRATSYGFGTIINTPILGLLHLDEADVAWMESRGVLLSVVTHEIAHALGFGPLYWGDQIRDMLRNPSIPNMPNADTHFAGPLTVAAFDAIGGTGYAGGKVPVENGAEPGSSDAHWRESVFGDELMTPFLTGETQPLSLVTIESLFEIWYEVNLDEADAFSLSSAGVAGMEMPRGPVIVDLSNDIADIPIRVSDQKTGRVIKVIRPGQR